MIREVSSIAVLNVKENVLRRKDDATTRIDVQIITSMDVDVHMVQDHLIRRITQKMVMVTILKY